MSIFTWNHISRARMGVLTLFLAVLTGLPAMAEQPVAITQCGTVISQPGHYYLANDLICSAAPYSGVLGTSNSTQSFQQFQVRAQAARPTGAAPIQDSQPRSGDAINIISDHVELLLNGHTIDGANIRDAGITVGAGVPSGNAFVHIVGPGTVTGFGTGIILEQASHSSVVGVTVANTVDGILLFGGFTAGCGTACPSTKNDLRENTVTFSFVGFGLEGAADNSLRDNIASNNVFGIALADTSTGNDLRANTTTNNTNVGIFVGLFGINVTNNNITHNTAQGNGSSDLVDTNADCDSNTWKHNAFATANQACIQ